MKTLETTLTRPDSILKTKSLLDSQTSIDAVFESIGKTLAEDSNGDMLVSSDAARSHIKSLNDKGMTYRTMAKLSGVHLSLIGRILYGKPSQNVPPQSQISITNSERLLSLTVNGINEADRKTDSTGSIRRVRAMIAMGYTQKFIAERSGVTREVLKEAVKNSRINCTLASAIKDTYEVLRLNEPPQSTPSEKNAYTRAKNEAAKNNWFPPEAWDDAIIDDPLQSHQVLTFPTQDSEKNLTRDCECKNVFHEHGTRAAYKADGCRCAPCKEANRVGSYRNRQLKAYGRSQHNMVDAAPARQHIIDLTKNGWGVLRIARTIGVGESTVWRIAYGEPGKTLPPKRILESTNSKIMGFTPEKREYGEGTGTVNERVDSTGTKRRIQALMSCGYSMTLIAKAVGISKNTVVKIMQGNRVRLTTADSFKVVYDKLWDVEPPRNTSFEKKAYTLAKKMARLNGWLPPMAWDDDMIDDPKHKAVA